MYSQIHRTVSPYSGLSHPHFSLNLLGVRHLETLAFETVLHSSQEPCFRVYTTNEDRPRSFGKVLPWVDMHSTQPLYRSNALLNWLSKPYSTTSKVNRVFGVTLLASSTSILTGNLLAFFFSFSKCVHHSRSTSILMFSVAVLTLSAFPHVVGNPVCLVLFWRAAREAWVYMSTISRFWLGPPYNEISPKPRSRPIDWVNG